MKKIFLFTDKGEDFSFLTKIVNKKVMEYPVMSAYAAGADQVYLLSNRLEVSDEKVKRINEDEIVDHVDKDDYIVFLSANMPMVKAKAINKIFEKLDRHDLVIEEADQYAGIYAMKGGPFVEFFKDNARKTIDVLRFKLSDAKITNLKGSNKLAMVTSYEDLSKADSYLRKSINKEYMKEGVFIEAPETVTIEAGVKIGKGTRIEMGTRILGKTEIGENCFIGSNSKIEDSIIHNNVDIYSSFIEKSEVEEYTNIGPFARLRPNAHLKKHVHIGNFVEVKNSVLGDGTKAGHLAYIGDAELGSDINVSCGVIFANYDGKFKHKAIVGDGAFLGSNVNLVAPVNIEKDSFIAAGSTVTKDVKEGYLVIERSERKDVEGYAAKKRARDLKIEQEKKATK